MQPLLTLVIHGLLTINVTEYGPVDARVKGNFNGIFRRAEYDQNTGLANFYYATVTNGHFEFLRHPDEN